MSSVAELRRENQGCIVSIVEDDAEILACLTGMSSARWGNGPGLNGWFKLWHDSPGHLGDQPSLGFAREQKVLDVLEKNRGTVHTFYADHVDAWLASHQSLGHEA